MGDPRRLRKKFESPRMIWDKARIEEESALIEEYGLKNMKELWRTKSELGRIRREARKLLSKGEQGKAESQYLLGKIRRLSLGNDNTTLEDLLSLTLRDLLERRLETRVFKKGFARSLKQSRQLIKHGFISIGGKKVSVPGHLVNASEDSIIGYYKAIDIGSIDKKEEAKSS